MSTVNPERRVAASCPACGSSEGEVRRGKVCCARCGRFLSRATTAPAAEASEPTNASSGTHLDYSKVSGDFTAMHIDDLLDYGRKRGATITIERERILVAGITAAYLKALSQRAGDLMLALAGRIYSNATIEVIGVLLDEFPPLPKVVLRTSVLPWQVLVPLGTTFEAVRDEYIEHVFRLAKVHCGWSADQCERAREAFAAGLAESDLVEVTTEAIEIFKCGPRGRIVTAIYRTDS